MVPTVFWGRTIARGWRSFPSQENSIALNLMTVQPEADQPKAETGADLVLHRTIENRGA